MDKSKGDGDCEGGGSNNEGGGGGAGNSCDSSRTKSCRAKLFRRYMGGGSARTLSEEEKDSSDEIVAGRPIVNLRKGGAGSNGTTSSHGDISPPPPSSRCGSWAGQGLVDVRSIIHERSKSTTIIPGIIFQGKRRSVGGSGGWDRLVSSTSIAEDVTRAMYTTLVGVPVVEV